MTNAQKEVALFTRAWIEISAKYPFFVKNSVALFTRAWIEIMWNIEIFIALESRPLHEGVD